MTEANYLGNIKRVIKMAAAKCLGITKKKEKAPKNENNYCNQFQNKEYDEKITCEKYKKFWNIVEKINYPKNGRKMTWEDVEKCCLESDVKFEDFSQFCDFVYGMVRKHANSISEPYENIFNSGGDDGFEDCCHFIVAMGIDSVSTFLSLDNANRQDFSHIGDIYIESFDYVLHKD